MQKSPKFWEVLYLVVSSILLITVMVSLKITEDWPYVVVSFCNGFFLSTSGGKLFCNLYYGIKETITEYLK